MEIEYYYMNGNKAPLEENYKCVIIKDKDEWKFIVRYFVSWGIYKSEPFTTFEEAITQYEKFDQSQYY
jgi:hypothetical protein